MDGAAMQVAFNGAANGKVTYAPGTPRIALMRYGAGPAVIFLHGLGAGKELWEPQLVHFSDKRQAIAWDVRGYGDSEDFEGPMRFAADVADDLLRVMAGLHLSTAHLVGLSMGGFIAQCFYHRYPGRVRSLVLADSFESFRRLLPRERLAGFLKARRDPLLAGRHPSDMAEETATSLLGRNADAQARRLFVGILSGLNAKSYIKAMEALVAEDCLKRASEILVPTCVIVGEEDRLTPPASCGAMADLIPNAEFHQIANAGHMTSLEQPQLFNQIVEKFLERQPL
jgi:3-oxoadipate enol-lactonase